ncbi:MAG: NlpC/P60 family protein [Jatrophihabitans sp.]
MAARIFRRPVALLAVMVIALTLSVAFAPTVSAAPKHPTQKQLDNAAAVKAQAAKDVKRLTGLLAAADAKVKRQNDKAAFAQQKVNKAIIDLRAATDAATTAKKNVAKAQKTVSDANLKFQLFLRSVYMHGEVDASGLLTSEDPSALLARGDLNSYTSSRQINGIGEFSRATVAKSNADAAARAAVANQTQAKNQADIANKAAQTELQKARSEQISYQGQKASFQTQLQAAGMRLTGLQTQQAQYNAWHKEQLRLAAVAAAKKRAALQKLIAEQARNRQASGSGTSSGGSSSGGGSGGGHAAPSGSWTPAKGRAAVAAAERWLGTPYAWGGGSFSGPTYGDCMDYVTTLFGDCHKIGFDCAGLTMYAWAQQGVYTVDYAPSQWNMGRVHPSPGQLMPGDLILYAYNGNPYNAHHVVMYIGNGLVIQAPQSGDHVRISQFWMDEWAGAVRPGS